MCIFTGTGPSDAPQPGSVEHGHEAVGGLREAGLPPAAALLPPRHLWKPAAALLQTRGTQQYFICRRPTTAAKTPTDLLNLRLKMLFLIFCHLMFQWWMFILNTSKVSDKVSVAYVQVLPVGRSSGCFKHSVFVSTLGPA